MFRYIKKALRRFLINWSKLLISVLIMIMMGSGIFLMVYILDLRQKGIIFSVVTVGGLLVELFLLVVIPTYIFFFERVVVTWPEYTVEDARDVLKENPELANLLLPLIKQVEVKGAADLKKWLESFREKELATTELEQLEKELNKEDKLRSRKEELKKKIKELSQQLGL